MICIKNVYLLIILLIYILLVHLVQKYDINLSNKNHESNRHVM